MIGSDLVYSGGPFSVTKIITVRSDPSGKHDYFSHNLSDQCDHDCSHQIVHSEHLITSTVPVILYHYIISLSDDHHHSLR